MKTLVLYEYPAASRDIQNWLQLMLEQKRVIEARLWSPGSDTPYFKIRNAQYDIEEVFCFPLKHLTERPDRITAALDGVVNKVVVFGKVDLVLLEAISNFMADPNLYEPI